MYFFYFKAALLLSVGVYCLFINIYLPSPNTFQLFGLLYAHAILFFFHCVHFPHCPQLVTTWLDFLSLKSSFNHV
jgi:hypothetical protein